MDPLIFLFTPVNLRPDGPGRAWGCGRGAGRAERVMLLDQISLHYAQHTLVVNSVRAGAAVPPVAG